MPENRSMLGTHDEHDPQRRTAQCLANTKIYKTIQKVQAKKIIGKDKDTNKKELFFYRVSKGDTLFSISKKFNIEIKTLVEMNRINGNKIYIGQELIIPNK